MSAVRTRLKSCLHCRRHRLRCDRLTRAPRPCTTCWKRGIECVFTNHSHHELVNSLAGLVPSDSPETVAGDSYDSTVPPPLESYAADTRSQRDASTEQPVPHVEDGAGRPLHLYRAGNPPTASYAPETTRAQELGTVEHSVPASTSQLPIENGTGSSLHLYTGQDVRTDHGMVVTAGQINDCFEHFVGALHPNFPFLSLPLNIEKILQTSPLLFWTIITIASHRDRTQYRVLQPYVRQLIAGILHPSGHGLESCQALCLICLWPFDAEDPNDDPSYLYAGMLSHLALRMGLHRPEFAHEFKDINDALSRDRKTHERWQTWCACQFVEHVLASKNGAPSGIRADWASKLKLRNRDNPGAQKVCPVIRHHLQLCAIRDRHLGAIAYEGQALSGLRPPKDRIGYLKLYHAELEDFEASAMPLDSLSAVFLNMSKVTLAGFCLARDLRPSIDEVQAILRSGLNAATAILDLVAPLAWETLPVHILRSLLYAGVFASQLTRCGIELYPYTELIVILERATDILRHLAHGQDFPTRGKIVLETELERYANGAGHEPPQSEGPSGVDFHARMEANMYWDLVESDKAKHNWNQTADDIYWELVLSGANPMSPQLHGGLHENG